MKTKQWLGVYACKQVINPWSICAGRVITVVVLCVCIHLLRQNLIRTLFVHQRTCHRVLYGVSKVFVMWLSLKMLNLFKSLAFFANCHCFTCFLTSFDKLPMHKSVGGFFSTKLVCRYSDSSYNTTDLSLIILRKFLSLYLLTWHYSGTHDTVFDYVIWCNEHSCGLQVTPVHSGAVLAAVHA